MYLALLNENEKEVFLGMAYNLATVDGNYCDAEKTVISGYCQELQYTFDEETMIKPMETLIQIVKEHSDDKVKKIFVFELIGLVMADGNYGDDEREMLGKMMAECGIEESFAEKCENIVSEYIEFQTRINQLVLG